MMKLNGLNCELCCRLLVTVSSNSRSPLTRLTPTTSKEQAPMEEKKKKKEKKKRKLDHFYPLTTFDSLYRGDISLLFGDGNCFGSGHFHRGRQAGRRRDPCSKNPRRRLTRFWQGNHLTRRVFYNCLTLLRNDLIRGFADTRRRQGESDSCAKSVVFKTVLFSLRSKKERKTRNYIP